MAQNILSISQLNEYIRGRMDSDPLLTQVAVRGEISNYKLYPSGHHYFTLKDETSALKCVMFKGNAMRLRFRPENGMKVIAMMGLHMKLGCNHRLRLRSCDALLI